MACGNEEHNYQDDNVLPVPDFTMVKLLMCSKLQYGWKWRHLDFQNDFPHGKLKRDIYVELPRHNCFQTEKESKVMLLKRSLHGLKDAAQI